MSKHYEYITSPWVLAEQRYIDTLSDEERAIYKSASLENIFYSTSVIQSRHQADSKTRVAMNKLQPLVAAIEQYDEALDVISNTGAISMIMCPLWGGIRVILHVAKQYDRYFEKFVDMLASIGDVLPKFRDYERIFHDEMRVVQALSVVYLDILVFCLKAKEVFGNEKQMKKWKSFMSPSVRALGLLWTPLDRRYGAIMDDILKHKKVVEAEARHVHLMKTSAAADLQKSGMDLELKNKAALKLKQIMDMLSSVDAFAQHEIRRKERFEGTGAWLVDHERYHRWRKDAKTTSLWIYGIPGCGKSIVMSAHHMHAHHHATYAVDILLSEAALNRHEITLYQYCDYKRKDTLDPNNIIGSLIKQTIRSSPASSQLLDKICRIYGSGRIKPSLGQLTEILLESLWRFRTVTICIDGLDEIDNAERKAFLSSLESMLSSNQIIIKTLVVSRHELDILRLFKDHDLLEISEKIVAQDMEIFVKRLVCDRVDCGDLQVRNVTLLTTIISRLTRESHKMFLWVRFQIDELCEAVTDAQIVYLLDHLPKDLEETYARILERISRSRGGDEKKKLAQRIFKRIAAALRPLSLDELQEFVGIDPGDKVLDFNKVPTDGLRMIQTCGNLIVYDKEENRVEFAHHTVLQFLSGSNEAQDAQGFQFSLDDALVEAAEICVTYLDLNDFDADIQKYKPKREFQDLKVLQKAIALNSNAMFGSAGSSMPKAIAGAINYKATKLQTSKIDYSMVIEPARITETPLQAYQASYKFLSYAIDYWLPHTAAIYEVFQHRYKDIAAIQDFTLLSDIDWRKQLETPGTMANFWAVFEHLSTERELLFDIKKWTSGKCASEQLTSLHTSTYLDLFAWATANTHFPLLWISSRTTHNISYFCNYDFCQYDGMPDTLLSVNDLNMFLTLLRSSSFECVRRSVDRAWHKTDQKALLRFIESVDTEPKMHDMIFQLFTTKLFLAYMTGVRMDRVLEECLVRNWYPNASIEIAIRPPPRHTALLLAAATNRLSLARRLLDIKGRVMLNSFSGFEHFAHLNIELDNTLGHVALFAALQQSEASVFILPIAGVYSNLAKVMREWNGTSNRDPRDMLELLVQMGLDTRVINQRAIRLAASHGYAKSVELLFFVASRPFDIDWLKMEAAIREGPAFTQAEIRAVIKKYELIFPAELLNAPSP